MSTDISPTWPLGRPQDRADEPPIAIEHHDRLEAIFVVMGIEQAQLLAAVHGIKGVVNVERDPLRHPPNEAQ